LITSERETRLHGGRLRGCQGCSEVYDPLGAECEECCRRRQKRIKKQREEEELEESGFQ